MPCCWVRSYIRREMTGCGHIVGELFLIGGWVFLGGGGGLLCPFNLSLSPPSLARPPPPPPPPPLPLLSPSPSLSRPHLSPSLPLSLSPSSPPFLPHSPLLFLSPSLPSLSPPSNVYVCVLPPSPLLSPSLSFVRSCSPFPPLLPPPPPPPALSSYRCGCLWTCCMSLREVSPVTHAKEKPTNLLLEQRYPVSGVLSLNLMLLNQCTHWYE